MQRGSFGQKVFLWLVAALRNNIQPFPHAKTLTFTKNNATTAQLFLDGSDNAVDQLPSGALFSDTPAYYFGGVRAVVKGAISLSGGTGTQFTCTDANGLELWHVLFSSLTANAVCEDSASGIVYKGSPSWTVAGGAFVAPLSIVADGTYTTGSDVVFTMGGAVVGHSTE